MGLKFNPLAPGGFVNIPPGGGAEGPPGPKGEFNYRQEWAAATAYAKGDAVTVGGVTYACIKAMTAGEDVSPPNATFWKVIAEKGAAGPEGPKGTTGEKGEKGEAGSPKTAKAPLEVSGTEIVLKALGITAEFLGPESVETAKIKDKAVTDAKLAGLTWVNVEAVNANLEQTVAIQVAVFNGLVFMRGIGKVKTELAAKAIIFTMPAAARPVAERKPTFSSAPTSTIGLTIKVNGEVEISALLAVGKIPQFDGIVYSL